MAGRSTNIARIRTVVLKDCHSCLLVERTYLAEIIVSPFTGEAGRTAEDHTAALSCFGIDHVNLIADPTAGQQGITAQFNTLGVGIFGELLEFSYIRFTLILHIQPRTEAEDHHLITGFRTLVDSRLHHLRIGRYTMQEDRVFSRPRGDLTVHPLQEKPFPVTVITVERHQPGTEATELSTGGDIFVRPHRQFYLQQTRGKQRIITL